MSDNNYCVVNLMRRLYHRLKAEMQAVPALEAVALQLRERVPQTGAPCTHINLLHFLEQKQMNDSAFRIIGGQPMQGEVTAQRSKNAVLPMIAAALLPRQGKTVLHGVPTIADVLIALEIARSVGAKVEHDSEGHIVTIDATNLHTGILPAEYSQKMRGSVLFLAPAHCAAGLCRATRERRLQHR
jgi:hypothetical protein